MYTSVESGSAAKRLVSRLGITPFLATVFLSAALVFMVQPLFARLAIPHLGGSPNVWNVSLVCFQAALLGGYAYAHALVRLVRSVRLQLAVHASLLVLAALALPLQLSGMFGPPDPEHPTVWLVSVFAVSIAPPFAIMSATAPLLQSWYSHTGRHDADDPYHLYSASNIGSLIGLAAYPLLLEPLLPLTLQTQVWSGGYVLLAGLLVVAGLSACFGPGRSFAPTLLSGAAGHQAADAVRRQRVTWLILAFIPSSLLVGVTTHISTDVASAPFLWAPPLMLYISSFIIVFAKKPAISHDFAARYLPPVAVLTLVSIAFSSGFGLIGAFAISLLGLFIAAVYAHGAMAKTRPDASRLTEFYLIMSLGGVLGGAFNALLAPVLFDSVVEYPLMVLALLAMRQEVPWWSNGRARVWLAATIGATVLAFLIHTMVVELYAQRLIPLALILVAVGGVMMGWKSRLVPVLSGTCLLAIGHLADPTGAASAERGFFGVVKIDEKAGLRRMLHGTTLHGQQFLDPARATVPTAYYSTTGPIGQVFTAPGTARSIGVVGLGTGAVACHARDGDRFTYFEIDPLVVRNATDPDRFTYLDQCTPDAEIVLGDGRLSLADTAEGKFDILLIDAFTSDAVPAHLMTREAIALYLSRLSEDGVLVLHVSNRYMKLYEVLARAAAELGKPALFQNYRPDAAEREKSAANSTNVVLMANTDAALADFAADPRWSAIESDGHRGWSDDYSNIVGAIWTHYWD